MRYVKHKPAAKAHPGHLFIFGRFGDRTTNKVGIVTHVLWSQDAYGSPAWRYYVLTSEGYEDTVSVDDWTGNRVVPMPFMQPASDHVVSSSS